LDLLNRSQKISGLQRIHVSQRAPGELTLARGCGGLSSPEQRFTAAAGRACNTPDGLTTSIAKSNTNG
jgi:hypothetical protein